MVFFYSRDSEKYKYTPQQGWTSRTKPKSKGTRVYPASCDLGEIAGIIEDFQGALSYEDIVYKYTIPQLMIMRMDKPSVEFIDESEKTINTAEDFFALINRKG